MRALLLVVDIRVPGFEPEVRNTEVLGPRGTRGKNGPRSFGKPLRNVFVVFNIGPCLVCMLTYRASM